jgi:RNA polymerase sigma-70 factor (ECF subfamily)
MASMTGDPRARHRTRLAARLYAEHSKDILAFFRCSRQMSMSDAGDFLQQTFAELLKTLESQPQLQIDNPRAFLFTLARRRLAAHHKRQARRPREEADDTAAEPASQAREDDLELLASLRSDQRLLLRAMRRLTDEDNARADAAQAEQAEPEPTVSDHQILLYLRFWAGLTLAEVAQVLGIPPGTVSGRQYRAMQMLRRRVDELGVPDEVAHRTSTTVLQGWQRALEREAEEIGPREGDGG